MEWIDVRDRKPEGIFWAWIKGRYEGNVRDVEIRLIEDKYADGDYRTLDEAGAYAIENDPIRNCFQDWEEIIAWMPYEKMTFPKRTE